MPDIRGYNWAAQLVNVNGWMFGERSELAYRVDRVAMGPRGPRTVPYEMRVRRLLSPHTSTVVKVWQAVTKYLGWDKKLSGMTSLWIGDFLKSVGNLSGFAKWELIGIEMLGDVWRGEAYITFTELQQDYSLGHGEWLQYIRLGHALKKHIREGETLMEAGPLEDRVLTELIQDKTLSIFYKKIINNAPDPTTALRSSWERDV